MLDSRQLGGREVKTIRRSDKSKSPEPPKNEAPKPPVSSAAPPPEPQGRDSEARVALVYYPDKDGNPDFSRMQPRVMENFRKFYARAENLKAIGIAQSESISASAPSELFGADEVNAFYDGLGFVDAVIAAKLYGVPFEMAQEAFTFDEFQRGKLTPRTQRLLNKWGPKVLAQWKDEIGLGIVLAATVSAHSRKLKKIRRLPATAPAPAPEKPVEKTVSSISDAKPASQPRTTPERPQTDAVDLENIGFNIS